MITCPECGTDLAEGTLFCMECGVHMFDAAKTTLRLKPSSGVLGSQQGWGTVTLVEGQRIVLQIGNVSQEIEIEAETDFILGRGEGKPPHMDLSAHKALELGVSRQHAALQRGDEVLSLIDLDSTNGTFLNGTRIAPMQAHLVRDGDAIRLGKLVMNIFFRSE